MTKSTDPHAKRKWKGIPLGITVQRQIGKDVIFRLQPGNGQAGSLKGNIYQHKYGYFVSPSINNPEGEWARKAFKQAVEDWQALTDQEKKKLDKRAERNGLRMSGYNLYIREAVKKAKRPPVKKVQLATITIPAGTGTGSAVISKVDPGKCEVLVHGASGIIISGHYNTTFEEIKPYLLSLEAEEVKVRWSTPSAEGANTKSATVSVQITEYY